MSYTWGVIWKDKESVLMGSIWWGLATTLLFGVPLLLILNYYEQKIPIWVGIIVVIILFPIITYLYYKAGSKKFKKEK